MNKLKEIGISPNCGCKRFEYDESGLGRVYGYNCWTCVHSEKCKNAFQNLNGVKHEEH